MIFVNKLKFYSKLFIVLFASSTIIYSSPLRIMPLGDSITYDNRVSDVDSPRPVGKRTAYRSHLYYSLVDKGMSIDFVGSQNAGYSVTPPFDSNNEGHPAWDSYDIAHDVYDFLITNPADIILLHIGTNDSGTDIHGVEVILDQIDAFEKEYNLPIRVVLALIIDNKKPNKIVSLFNSNLNIMALDRIRKGDNIIIVDMYTNAGLTSSDYDDYKHPNDNGYKKMANMWVNPIITNRNDSIYLYPITLVDRSDIIDINIDELNDSVTFTTEVPDNGIIF